MIFHKNMSRFYPGQKSNAGITTTAILRFLNSPCELVQFVNVLITSVCNRISEHAVAHLQGRYSHFHV
jgi:hypothetical protein